MGLEGKLCAEISNVDGHVVDEIIGLEDVVEGRNQSDIVGERIEVIQFVFRRNAAIAATGQ